MAIDPATAKLLAQLVVKAVTDEETRKKILFVALIPIISVLLILSMFQYLISHPWEYFESTFSGSSSIQIKQFHDKYYIEPKQSEAQGNEVGNVATDPTGMEVEDEEENNN